ADRAALPPHGRSGRRRAGPPRRAGRAGRGADRDDRVHPGVAHRGARGAGRGAAARGEPLPRRPGLHLRPDDPDRAGDRPAHRDPRAARGVADEPAPAGGDPRRRRELGGRAPGHGDPRRRAPAAVRGVRPDAVLLTGRSPARYGRGVSATTLPIPTDAGDLPGLLWLPEDRERPVPGVVVLQEIFGLSDYVQQRCADLAALGYAVLAPQLFARLDPPVMGLEDREDADSWPAEGMERTARLPRERAEADAVAALGALRGLEAREDAGSWLAGGMGLTARLPWERAEADAIAALGALRAHGAVDPERVGLMGFCYGGGLAFAATAGAAAEDRPPSVLVSYY